MAEHRFRIVPVDPRFCPVSDAIDVAEALVRALMPSADEVHGACRPGIHFIDALGLGRFRSNP